MPEIDWYAVGRFAAQCMLVGGISGQVAQIMNYFFPNTIDGKPMSHYFKEDYD